MFNLHQRLMQFISTVSHVTKFIKKRKREKENAEEPVIGNGVNQSAFSRE